MRPDVMWAANYSPPCGRARVHIPPHAPLKLICAIYDVKPGAKRIGGELFAGANEPTRTAAGNTRKGVCRITCASSLIFRGPAAGTRNLLRAVALGDASPSCAYDLRREFRTRSLGRFSPASLSSRGGRLSIFTSWLFRFHSRVNCKTFMAFVNHQMKQISC